MLRASCPQKKKKKLKILINKKVKHILNEINLFLMKNNSGNISLASLSSQLSCLSVYLSSASAA